MASQILAFLLFEAGIWVTGSADYRRRDYAFLGMIQRSLFIIVLISSVLGKGGIRWLAVISGAGMMGVWVLLGMAM